MTLEPIRHPNRDFFILDLQDVAPKVDTASAEHPFYSLSTRPDMRELYYGEEGNALTIIPSGKGLPTIFDKDVLIFCVSQIMALKNAGKPYGKRVQFSAHDLLEATNRPTNNLGYDRLEDAFARLRGTSFKTDIRTGDKVEKRIFGMIEEGGFTYRWEGGKQRRGLCEVVLSDWMMRAIEATEVVTISPKYFRLRRPLERRIYEIARKHCGKQDTFKISLEKLQAKTGSTAPSKKFRLNLRQIIEDNHTPDYVLSLDDRDIVTIKPRPVDRMPGRVLFVSDRAKEKAKELLLGTGDDLYAIEAQWMEKARESGEVKNADAAFLGYVKGILKKRKGGR